MDGLVQEKTAAVTEIGLWDYERIRKEKTPGGTKAPSYVRPNITNIILPGTLAVFRPL